MLLVTLEIVFSVEFFILLVAILTEEVISVIVGSCSYSDYVVTLERRSPLVCVVRRNI